MRAGEDRPPSVRGTASGSAAAIRRGITAFPMTDLAWHSGRSPGLDLPTDRFGPGDHAGITAPGDASRILPLADAALAAIAQAMAGAAPQRRAEADAVIAASLSTWHEGRDGLPSWPRGAASLMSRREIGEFFRLGKSAAYDLTMRAGFPPPVVVSSRCLRWPQRDVTEFAESLRDGATRRRARPHSGRRSPVAPGQRRITGRVRAVGERKGTP